MRLNKLIVFGISLAMVSCKKELINKVQFQNPAKQYDLVVEGGVNSLDVNQFIKLSKPAFKISDNTEPINDAQVFINDVQLKILDKDGRYTTNLLNNKRYDESYRLKIIYNGKTYYAEDSLKKVGAINPKDLNVRMQKNDDSTFFSVPKHIFNAIKAAKIFYQLPSQTAWTPGFFGASPYYVFVHTDAPPYGLSPVLEKRTNYILKPADSITVYKFSVSKDYERFLYTTFQETDWKSLFSSTPGSIKGNISGDALGYFSCTDGVSKKISVESLVN